MPLDPKFVKTIDSLISVQQELNTLKQVNDTDLRFTLCNRTNTDNNRGHYFMSLRLPYVSTYFDTGSTLSLRYPELQQLNTDEMIMIDIPPGQFSEFIDGRNLQLDVPIVGFASLSSQTSMSSLTLYSSTYTSDKPVKSENSPLIGDNVCFLFSDAINTPYTGFSTTDTNILVAHSGTTTWGPTDWHQRPSAVSYNEAKSNTPKTWGTDTRTNAKHAVQVDTTYPEGRSGYNYDIPCGFCALDRGFCLITHTAITANFAWASGYTDTFVPYAGSDVTTKYRIYFSGTTDGSNKAAQLEFYDIDTAFRTTAVCLALPREFYVSNNPTWDRARAIANLNEEKGFISFDPLYITELGLYNVEGDLVALAKTTEPVTKIYTNVVVFNVDIDL